MKKGFVGRVKMKFISNLYKLPQSSGGLLLTERKSARDRLLMIYETLNQLFGGIDETNPERNQYSYHSPAPDSSHPILPREL